MHDHIVISSCIADLPASVSPPAEAHDPMIHGGDATFGSFGLRFLDHSAFESLTPRQRGRLTRPYARLAAMIGRLLKDTGLDAAELSGPRTGLISGSTFGCSRVYNIHKRLRRMGPRGIDAVRFAQATHNYPVSACAIDYKIEGPCLAVVSTETAGFDALLCAWDWLKDERCDRVLVTAYEDFAPPLTSHLARRAKDNPGRVFGESMVLLLLERKDLAEARGCYGLPMLSAVAPLKAHNAGAPLHMNRTTAIDFLGAGGLVALHEMIASGAGSPATDAAHLAADTSSTGAGVTVQVAFNELEPC